MSQAPDPTYAVPPRGPAATFDESWPQIHGRLRAALLARRVPADHVDDVVQETALRLYRAWSSVDPDRPLLPYAVTIAMNHWRDTLRRDPFREVPGDVPEKADLDDVERIALARLEVSRVSRALRQLRPRDREVLLSADVVPDGPVPAARRMMLMRARRELLAILETASAWAGAAVAGVALLRKLPLGKAQRGGRTAFATTGALAAGLASFVITSPFATPLSRPALSPATATTEPAPLHPSVTAPVAAPEHIAAIPAAEPAAPVRHGTTACVAPDSEPVAPAPAADGSGGRVVKAGPVTVVLLRGKSVASVEITATGTHVESQSVGCATVVPTGP